MDWPIFQPGSLNELDMRFTESVNHYIVFISIPITSQNEKLATEKETLLLNKHFKNCFLPNILNYYCKTCLKRPLKNIQNKGLNGI